MASLFIIQGDKSIHPLFRKLPGLLFIALMTVGFLQLAALPSVARMGLGSLTLAMVGGALLGIAKRLNFDYTIWTENKLSVSQPISLFLLFACAHLCSIGLRSGEYVGKYSTIYPASMMTC